MIKKKAFKLIFTALVCFCLVVTIVPRAQNIWELSQRKSALEKQKAVLMEKNEALTKEYEKAKSLENVERIAREQLGMVKNGETIIMPAIAND